VVSSGLKKNKVLITAPWFTKQYLDLLKERFDVTANSMKRWFTEEELLGIISDYQAVIAGLDPFTSKVIERAHNLKIIARRGIGYDNIDVESCKRRQIVVTNTPVPEEHQAVAEFTVGLILDAAKNITRSSNSLKSGSWERGAFQGRNIKGMTIGIVGLGNIGRMVAKIISAFGANVIYYDPYVKNPKFSAVDIDELFSKADVVSIHLPKTVETDHLIKSDLLDKMKQGSIIVNTSRSIAVVQEDLLKALRSGRISAALDVFDQEPPLHNDPLLELENVVATPHIAGLSVESFNAIDETCVNNVISVLKGRKAPKFVVA
jgi:D-3-phosphoglycerate dehydrogenase